MRTRRLSSATMEPADFAKALVFALKSPDVRVQVRADLRAELGALKMKWNNRVQDLEDQVESLEQYWRRNCLTISGVQETYGEDVGEKVLEIFNNRMDIQPKITSVDIDRLHRVGVISENRPRGVIVCDEGAQETLQQDYALG